MHGELSYLFNDFASQPGFKWGTSDVWMAKGEAFSESVVLQAFLPRAAGTSTASFAKFSRIKRYQGKILAITNVLVQVSAENLKCKSLYRYTSCPQTFAKIPTDQRELCERGCTVLVPEP